MESHLWRQISAFTPASCSILNFPLPCQEIEREENGLFIGQTKHLIKLSSICMFNFLNGNQMGPSHFIFYFVSKGLEDWGQYFPDIFGARVLEAIYILPLICTRIRFVRRKRGINYKLEFSLCL